MMSIYMRSGTVQYLSLVADVLSHTHKTQETEGTNLRLPGLFGGCESLCISDYNGEQHQSSASSVHAGTLCSNTQTKERSSDQTS